MPDEDKRLTGGPCRFALKEGKDTRKHGNGKLHAHVFFPLGTSTRFFHAKTQCRLLPGTNEAII